MKLLQRWQFSSQAEPSLSAELDLCQQYGYDGILAKALDGTMWMAQVDSNPQAIHGPDTVEWSVRTAHDRGLKFGIWVNPLQQDIDTQAQQAIDCLNAGADCIAFDTEPYDGFWGNNAPQGLADRYAGLVEAGCPAGVPRIWQPDPRAARLAELRPQEWADHMTHYAPQVYWSDFYFNPTLPLAVDLLATSRVVADSFMLDYWPTLPGNADPSTFPVDQIAAGCEGLVVWRIGSTPADTLTMIGGIQLTNNGTAPGDCSEETARANKFDLFFRDLANRVVIDQCQAELARRTKTGRQASPRVSFLEALIEQTQNQYNEAYGIEQGQAIRAQMVGQAVRIPGVQGNIAEGSNLWTHG